MFKQLTLNKETFVSYYSNFKSYHFTLEGKQNDETFVKYSITFHLNKTFSIIENVNEKHQYFDHVNENHPLIQKFQQTNGFKQAMNHIQMYEQRMKNELKMENIFLEGKFDNQTYVLSFQLTSPILNTKTIELKPGTDETNSFLTIIPQVFLYIALKREKKFIAYSDIKINMIYSSQKGVRPTIEISSFYNWMSLNSDFYTHHSFIEDIADILLKDPRIRVKLLVT